MGGGRRDKAGRPHARPGGPGRGLRLAAAGLIGLAAGCGQLGLRGERAEPRGDPLLGTFTPSPAPAPPGGGELPGAVERGPGERGPGGRGPEGRPAAGPPPETKLPSSFPLLRGPEITNAAMAAGLRPRPGNASDLRLEGAEGQGRDAPRGGASGVAGPDAGVLLRPPPAANVPPPPDPPVSRYEGSAEAPPAAEAPRGADSVADALADLRRLGAREEKSEQLPDGTWRFSCAVPNPQNELIQRRYEARDPDRLKAVTAVLEQVRRDAGR